MNKFIIVTAAALLLSACASGPSSKRDDVPVPTYTEKVGGINVEDLKPAAGCPGDSKWEGQDWRKVVGYANACVKAKDWLKVEKIGNWLAVNAHLTPWGAYYMSLAAQSRKDYPRANWMLELALKKAPSVGIFHYQMGRLQWEMGEEKAALESLKKASDLDASLTDAHYVMGQMALNKEDYSAAETLLRKALANDSKHWPATMAMASLKMKKGDWTAAENMLEDAVHLNPRSAKARLALAQVQELHLKKMQEALNTYKELKSMAQEKKLDDRVQLNLDEKIQTLEKSLSQASQVNKGSQLVRKPTAEGQAKR